MQESTAQLQHAIDQVHLRFGEQALLRANRLPPAEPWPSGLAEIDRLTGIRGLPKGRLSVLQGPTGSDAGSPTQLVSGLVIWFASPQINHRHACPGAYELS